MDLRAERSEWWRRAEWAVCLAATLAAIGLHGVFLTHAGPLWRDEANGIHLATLPSFGQMWGMLRYDSFPALFPALLRCWSGLGLGQSDIALRCLGLAVGLAVLGALWLNARVLRSSLPLLSLGLLAANTTLVRFGDALRGYGLGCLLILLTLPLIWSLMKAPSAGRFLAAALAAILSVQCLYQNAFLLFAICVAGCFVGFRCGQNKVALLVLGVGAAAAVSLLPYVGLIASSGRWRMVQQAGVSGSVAWSSLTGALGDPMEWQTLFWIAPGLVVAVRGLIELGAPERRKRIGVEDLPLFAGIIVAVGGSAFLILVLMAKLPTQPWYWLPPMVVAAVCIDAALGSWFDRYRPWRLVPVALMVFVPLYASVSLAKLRQTNIDLIAARLRDQAKPNDLILVYPWYNGVSFSHYYHGTTPWITLPALSDSRIHRYDLLKERLAATAPIKPVLDRVAEALNSGNRLWIVGDLPAPEPGETVPPDLPPAPDGPQGWFDVPYSYVWGRQVEHFVAEHGGRLEVIPTGSVEAVNPYEKLSLSVAKGWSLR